MIEKLRGFNEKLDEFLIEVSFPLLILGFIMATMDWLQHGQLATNGAFMWLWSGVQAIAIDGVFIAIWLRIFFVKVSWSHIFLVIAGLIMALMVGMVNDIVTYQELNHVVDSLTAMHDMHIDVATFTHVSAFLVIFVAILLIPLRKPVAIQIPEKRTRKSYRDIASKATVIEEKAMPVAIPEKAEAIEPTKKELCIARWEESDKGRGVKKAIALELGLGYSTVKKYLEEATLQTGSPDSVHPQ